MSTGQLHGPKESEMKRLHVHVSVSDLAESIEFYRTLFGAAPSVREADYAKWLLDDPRVNFAISARGRAAGLDHLGVQVESDAELAEIAGRLAAAERPVLEQKDAACCYAKSDKAWSTDPSGVRWETFRTHGALTVYGADAAPVEAARPGSACCNA
jgi:catechol 2,3-dioxygenase-like lactoylglutathione lyase family enzyme